MKPVAIRSQYVAYPLPGEHERGGCMVVGPGHTYHKLDAVAAHVYAHADGSRDVAALALTLQSAGVASADASLVYEALDRLADAGLLAQRVAPPAGVSRRVLLQRLAGASALAALTAALGLPRSAEAAATDLCGAELDLINEIAYLEAQAGLVADVLDGWADALDKDPKADPFYADALRAKEEEWKTRNKRYAVKLDDVTEDLNACKLQKPRQQEADAKRKSQIRLKLRTEEQDAKAIRAQQQFAERLTKLRAKEADAKREMQIKLKPEQLAGATEESAKIEATREERLDLRRRNEQDYKAMDRQRVSEQAKKSAERSDFKYLNAEEREKAYADAYVTRATESAQKAVGETDYAMATAKEENEKAWVQAGDLRKQEATMKQDTGTAAEQEKKKLESVAAEQNQKKLDAVQAEQNQKVIAP